METRLADGGVQCWGEGTGGQLGDGNLSNSSIPVSVSGLSSVSEIASGADSTCARLASGKVKCWGAGDSGQLGNGGTATAGTPVLVSNLNNAIQISADGSIVCVVTTNETVSCWGDSSQMLRLTDSTSFVINQP